MGQEEKKKSDENFPLSRGPIKMYPPYSRSMAHNLARMNAPVLINVPRQNCPYERHKLEPDKHEGINLWKILAAIQKVLLSPLIVIKIIGAKVRQKLEKKDLDDMSKIVFPASFFSFIILYIIIYTSTY